MKRTRARRVLMVSAMLVSVLIGGGFVYVGVNALALRDWVSEAADITAILVGLAFIALPAAVPFIRKAKIGTSGAEVELDLGEGEPASDETETPGLSRDAARALAFETAWFIMLVRTDQVPHPRASLRQIEGYAARLGLVLPDEFPAALTAADDWAANRDLVVDLIGQLSASRPDAAPYLEAAYNLVVTGGHGHSDQFAKIVESLDLPAELQAPDPKLIAWANQIHKHFEKRLRDLGSIPGPPPP